MFLCINLYDFFSNSRPLTFKSAHSAFSHSMSRLSRWNLMKGEMFVCQYFERHSTFRFDIEFPLQTFMECSVLKGQGFEETGRDIFQSDTLETIRLPGSRRQIPKMLSQIIRLKFILVPSYLSCKLEEFDFLVGLIRRRCSRNVQGTGRFQRIVYRRKNPLHKHIHYDYKVMHI